MVRNLKTLQSSWNDIWRHWRYAVDHVFGHGQNTITIIQAISAGHAPYFSGIKLFLSLITNSVIPYNVHVHIIEDKADKLVDGKEDGKPTYSTIAPGVDLIFDNANIRWVYIANDW